MATKIDEIRDKIGSALSEGDPHKGILLGIVDEIEKIHKIIPDEAWQQSSRPEVQQPPVAEEAPVAKEEADAKE